MILYVKMEVQMRKLVAFLLRTDTHRLHWSHIVRYIESKERDPDSWRGDFDRYKPSKTRSFKIIVGGYNHESKSKSTKRSIGRKKINKLQNLRKFRGKIFHGVAVSDDDYNRFRHDDPNSLLIDWIKTVANSMDKEIGYDGLSNMRWHPDKSKNYRFDEGDSYSKVESYLNSIT